MLRVAVFAVAVVAAAMLADASVFEKQPLQQPPKLQRATWGANLRNPSPCVSNITNAGSQVAVAIVDIIKSVGICGKPNSTAACVAEISDVAAALAQAGEDISMAVTACGAPGSLCATDLLKLGNNLAKAASDVATGLQDCEAQKDIQCIEEVVATSEAIGSIFKDIGGAVKDCSHP